jgi:hypothetical protein
MWRPDAFLNANAPPNAGVVLCASAHHWWYGSAEV